MTEFEMIYESWMSRLAGTAVVGAGLLGGMTPQNVYSSTNQVSSKAENDSMSLLTINPLEFAKTHKPHIIMSKDAGSFTNFYKELMMPILFKDCTGVQESFYDEDYLKANFNSCLRYMIKMFETGGKYTPDNFYCRYIYNKKYGRQYGVVFKDKNGPAIGDGISINDCSLVKNEVCDLIRANLNMIMDSKFNPITSVTNYHSIHYVERNAIELLQSAAIYNSAKVASREIEIHGGDIKEVDPIARLAFEDLIYNVGASDKEKKYKMVATHLANTNYVGAAYEIVNSQDFKTSDYNRNRRITECNLMLYAAKRAGQLSPFENQFKYYVTNSVTRTFPNGYFKYVVKKGDSPWKIAKRYKLNLNVLMDDNSLTNELAKKLGPGDIIYVRKTDENMGIEQMPEPDDKAGSHVVKKGDTLDSIAREYKVSKSEIKKLNNIIDENKIFENMVLAIPMVKKEQSKQNKQKENSEQAVEEISDDYYVVKKNDNLWKITKLFGITRKKLYEMNPGLFERRNDLKIGEKLRVKNGR